MTWALPLVPLRGHWSKRRVISERAATAQGACCLNPCQWSAPLLFSLLDPFAATHTESACCHSVGTDIILLLQKFWNF
ncbi:hypothetical protein EVAR_48649_1 [Eumeta japonica]|uniref:Uncharacterized protein n=1 Tax=Eumeta variegata TaxID=151549 RepID=A0A4C1XQB2_EUMVA|nr:hypothetical protein EVAR_48649_1 [Eumeta japonica]